MNLYKLFIFICVSNFSFDTNSKDVFLVQDKINFKNYLEKKIEHETGHKVFCPLALNNCVDALNSIDHDKSYLNLTAPTILSYRKLRPFTESNIKKIIYFDKINSSKFDLFSKIIEVKDLNENEQEFYKKLFTDGILKISLFNGYFDHGNDLFNYHIELFSREIFLYFLKQNNFIIDKITPTEIKANLVLSSTKKIELNIYQSFMPCGPKEIDLVQKLNKGLWGEERTAFLNLSGLKFTFIRALCEKQEAHSMRIKKLFLNAIDNTNILIYNGHSRHGRGPDFGHRYSKSGSVSNYLLTKNILKSKKLKSVYFNGCSGKENYPELISSFPTISRVIAWNDRAPEFHDTFYNLTAFLQGIIEHRAIGDIELRTNLLRRTDKWPSKVLIRGLD